MDRRNLLKYAAGGATLIAGSGTVGFVWLDRKFNPKTPLNYQFPDIAPPAGSDLIATQSCDETGVETLRQTEGPYYTPHTPQRSVLRESSTVGIPLVVEGVVTDTQCRPVAGAVIDLWSCDGDGIYDNDGFHLRGHQFTDANGNYRFNTIKPAAYQAGFAQRTPHIHVKVQGRNTSLLTTQLYFPDEALNAHDSIFSETLLLRIISDEGGGNGFIARYDFVLA